MCGEGGFKEFTLFWLDPFVWREYLAKVKSVGDTSNIGIWDRKYWEKGLKNKQRCIKLVWGELSLAMKK